MSTHTRHHKVPHHFKWGIVVFVAVFWTGFFLAKGHQGPEYSRRHSDETRQFKTPQESLSLKARNLPHEVVFACANKPDVRAIFRTSGTVDLQFSNGRVVTLSKSVSASGARYANADESFIFWDKGGDAFIEENGSITYSNCVIRPVSG